MHSPRYGHSGNQQGGNRDTPTVERPMSTEEYLRTEVFGEADRMQQKRRDNVTYFPDRPMTMEEYVKYAVFGEDLPPHLDTRQQARQRADRNGVPRGAVGLKDTVASQPVRPASASTSVGNVRATSIGGGVFGSGTAGQVVSALADSTTSSGVLRVAVQRDATGRIAVKTESRGQARSTSQYAYDADGRLTLAALDGRVTERYIYNERGQRVQDATAWRGERSLAYDAAGRLVQAGGTVFEYTPEGSLLRRIETDAAQGGTAAPATRVSSFRYGADTRLDSVQMPDGTEILYLYGAALGPVEKLLNGQLAESYIWLDAIRLGAWIDHQRGVRCLFHYGADGRVVAVTMESARGAATYGLGLDQVGTVKAVVASDGTLIKEIAYDSFGSMIRDSNPEFFLPIGFASGIVDRHTGLIRFGYRDYDPEIGRFTALDPAKDMRGDGDLWDYCVDDPINAVDPWGLWAAPFQMALAGATYLAYGGAKGAAYLADKLNGQGDKARREVDGIFEKHVVPINTGLAGAAAGAAALEATPGTAAAVREAATSAGTAVRNAGLDAANAVLSRPETINGAGLSAIDATTGYFLPGPYEPTKAGALGYGASVVKDAIDNIAEISRDRGPSEEKK